MKAPDLSGLKQLMQAIPTYDQIETNVINNTPVGAIMPTLSGQAFAMQQVFPPIGEYRRAPAVPPNASPWQKLSALFQHPQVDPQTAQKMLQMTLALAQARNNPQNAIEMAKLLDKEIETALKMYESTVDENARKALLPRIAQASQLKQHILQSMLGLPVSPSPGPSPTNPPIPTP